MGETYKSYADSFSEKLVQISKLFWLTAIDLEDPTTEFKEFIEEHTKEELAKIFEEDAFLSLEDEDNDERYLEQVTLLIYDNKRLRYGFLATLAIPMRSSFTEHGCMIHGGVTHCPIIYAKDLDELCNKAMEEADRFKKLDKKEDDKNKKKKKGK